MTELAGRRILVAEDEAMIAWLLKDILVAEQCTLIGPCGTVREALQAAQTEEIDLALLNADLCGKKVFPVAEELARRNVPFLLLFGYGAEAVPSEHPEWPWHGKPFKGTELLSHMQELLNHTAPPLAGTR